jgi:hypothetical protein
MFSANRITPDTLYPCYSSFITNPDTLYSKLIVPLLIEFDCFVTINTNTQTHNETLCSVEDKALLHQSEGRGFRALCNE